MICKNIFNERRPREKYALIRHCKIADSDEVVMSAFRVAMESASELGIDVARSGELRCCRLYVGLPQKRVQDPDVFEPAVQTLAVEWNHGMRGVPQENGPVQIVVRV